MKQASPPPTIPPVGGGLACLTFPYFLLSILFWAALPSAAQNLTPDQRQLNLASFEQVWSTVRDKHWETKPAGLDWQAIHEEFLPRVQNAQSTDAARAAMREMLARLHQTHFGILSSSAVADVDGGAGGDGTTGIDVRVLDGRAIVTEVEPGSAAARAGVKTGWEIVSVEDRELRPLIAKLVADVSVHDLQLTRAVLARTTGPVGATHRFVFSASENGSPMTRHLALAQPRGEMAGFGNLAPQPVWFSASRIGPDRKIALIRLTVFLDLVRVMNQFGEAVKSCGDCRGIIIDLRGNPGGIGGMAMGLAGWLIHPDQKTQPDLRLGSMFMRGAALKFFINPRADAFQGPVAILVDGASASTSEIFAGGLQDLHRARVFGTRTAAAALPSVITRLPNGDGFQYAVANYISEGGRALEGNGVTPDVEVRLTREGLLAGHDAVVDAAVEWLGQVARR